jgi:hypothetical protein
MTSSPDTMRAAQLSAPGGVDNLRLTTLALAAAGPADRGRRTQFGR